MAEKITGYELILSSVVVEEANLNSYGIAYRENGKIQKFINDVSVDENAVKKLVRLFNKLHLDPIQLEEAVEDALT